MKRAKCATKQTSGRYGSRGLWRQEIFVLFCLVCFCAVGRGPATAALLSFFVQNFCTSAKLFFADVVKIYFHTSNSNNHFVFLSMVDKIVSSKKTATHGE